MIYKRFPIPTTKKLPFILCLVGLLALAAVRVSRQSVSEKAVQHTMSFHDFLVWEENQTYFV